MSTYRASVRVEDGMLHTARPLTAPEAVTGLIDGLIYQIQAQEADLIGVDLTVETATDSGTPLADSSVGTTSAPLPDTGQHTAAEPPAPDEIPAPVPTATVP